MIKSWKIALTAIFSAAMISAASFYCINKLIYLQTKIAPDIQIFLEHGEQFRLSGNLYRRANENASLEFLYSPSGSEFKFPPAAQIFLYPFFRHGIDYLYIEPMPGIKGTNEAAFTPFRIFLLFLYTASLLITAFWCGKNTWGEMPAHKKILLGSAFYATAAISEPLFANIHYVNFEILIFFIISLSCLCVVQKKYIAGFLSGIAAGIKIYPSFLALHFFAARNFQALIGFSIGILLTLVAGYVVFGGQETSFYFSAVLPQLLHEPITTHDYNLSLGKIFLKTGFYPDILFNLFRVIVIGFYFYVLVNTKKTSNTQRELLAVSLITMLFFLKNYWSAYQVFILPAYFIVCMKTIIKPTYTNIIAIAFCNVALFMDQYWWGETQLLQEFASTNPDGAKDYWANQTAIEHQAKSFIFPIPHMPTVIYYLTQSKIFAPFVLWAILVADLIRNPQHLTGRQYP
jgi:hypothetical protein